VKSNSEVVQFAASWAAVWLMDALQWSPEKDPGALVDLASIWRRFDDREWSYIPAWALVSMPILNRKTQPLAELSVGIPGFIANQVTQNNLFKKWAAFVLAHYIKAPWGDEELAHRVASEDSRYSSVPQYRERLLAALKQEGIMPKQASADPPTK